MVRRRGASKSGHIAAIVMSLAAVAITGAIFLVALFRELALVEVAASLLAGLQVFFLSSAIGDFVEEKKEPSRARNSAVVLVTLFLVAFYSFARYLH